MKPIIHGLSNEQYHHGQEESQYLSSSQLKMLAVSPKAFRYAIDNPSPQTDAMRLGSLFHDLMACCAEHFDNGTAAIARWNQSIAVFEPPVNDKTGQPYGAATKTYKETYEIFLQLNKDKNIVSEQERLTAERMAESVIMRCGATSEQLRRFLKRGKPEVSHFIEIDGIKYKWRPDLDGSKIILDYKTVATADLSERSINNIIAKYGYDISAAYYQWLEHEQSGVWKTFYWLFVTKNPPYDAVLVDASKWTYDYDPDLDIVLPQVGAIKCQRLVRLHRECKEKDYWPGAEINIPEGFKGRRIMMPTPPPWEVNNASEILEYE